MVAVFTVELDDAGWEAADEAGAALLAAGVLELEELPHAVATSATAARPADAHHLPRIAFLHSLDSLDTQIT
jgi:hypothetical protein